MIAKTASPPYLEVTDEVDHVRAHLGEFYQLRGPPMPPHLEGAAVKPQWVRVIGDHPVLFKASGEFYRATLKLLPWNVTVVSYDKSIDTYTLRLGDLKSGARSYCNEN